MGGPRRRRASPVGHPVRYQRSRDAAWVRVTRNDGTSHTMEDGRLDAATSASLLGRRGEIAHLDVGVPESDLRDRP